MLKTPPVATPAKASLTTWTYSPVPAVESALQALHLKYPPLYPAGLERLHRFLAKLGNPQQRLPFTFHAAGTNGKGSTLAFLQAIFEAGGLAVHKYTSPHLVRFEERIVLSGKTIDPDLLLQLTRECDKQAEGESVSFFEFFTALFFLAASRSSADVLLLETGLGGIYDATNVIDGKNIISLLTRISYDHTHILGNSLAEIARNKAGIIKPGCPAIVAPQPPEAQKVFTRQAAEKEAPVFLYGRDWETDLHATSFSYRSAKNALTLPIPRLLGQHQIYNAGTAIAAIENSPYAFLLDKDTLQQAMLDVSWPGRLQHLTSGTLSALLPQGWELWLDGAHNDSGAEVLTDQVKVWGKEKPLHLLTAMKKTKDAAGFYRSLLPHTASVQAIDVGWIEAPMTPAQALCDQIRGMGYAKIQVAANLESAISALTFQFTTPQRILITGSLYLVGHALKN